MLSIIFGKYWNYPIIFWNIHLHVTKSKLKVFSWCISSLRMQTQHYNSYRDRKICEIKTQNIGPRVRAADWNISSAGWTTWYCSILFILFCWLMNVMDELIYPGYSILHVCMCKLSFQFYYFYPFLSISLQIYVHYSHSAEARDLGIQAQVDQDMILILIWWG